jgi:hypothetical protein
MSEVITSLGVGITHDTTGLTISSVTGSGPFTVTMSAGEGDNFDVGDALWDEHATPRKYLVLAVSGDVLTVRDSEAVGSAPDNSGTSAAAARRYYNGSTPIADWESELTSTDLYSSGDDAIGECWNDASLPQSNLTMNSAPPSGTATLSVAESERHDGTEGTGAVVDVIGNGKWTLTGGRTLAVEWLEFNCSYTTNANNLFNLGNNTNTTFHSFSHNIVHGGGHIYDGRAIVSVGGSSYAKIHNNFIYDNNGTVNYFYGIYASAYPGRDSYVYNNTLLNNTATSGSCRGIRTSSDTELQNNIVLDSDICFYAGSSADSYNLSSDLTAAGTGSITNATASDIVISTVGGSEDLHLKAGSQAINAGSSAVGSEYSIDINGNDRTGMPGWSIGAHNYALNIDDQILTSIGAGITHDTTGLTISSVTGSGPFAVTMGVGEGDYFDAGDALWDEHSAQRKYRVFDTAGDVVYAVDSEAVGEQPDNSGTSTAAAKRYYNGSTPATDWEIELDSNADLYASGDTAVGELWNDADFTESFNFYGGSTLGLPMVRLTVAPSERHDGTAGTGVRFFGKRRISAYGTSGSRKRADWIEMDGNGTSPSGAGGLFVVGKFCYASKLIVHSIYGVQDAAIVIVDSVGSGTNPQACLQNSIVYDGDSSGTAGSSTIETWGILMLLGSATDVAVYNCTIHNVNNHDMSNSGSSSYGLYSNRGGTDKEYINLISTDVANDGAGTVASCLRIYSGSRVRNCLTSDGTAAVSSGINPQINKLTANQYQSTVVGSEDLHLKAGSDAIDNGVNLSIGIYEQYDYAVDIDGNDRDVLGGDWDIGAHEYIASLVIVPLTAATETDTAIVLTVELSKIVSLASAAETDLAVAITVVNPRSYQLTSAAETDLAVAITVVNPRSYQLASVAETDSAVAITVVNPRSYQLTSVSETDAVAPLTVEQSKIVSLASAAETDSAIAIAVANPRSYQLASAAETDSAIAISLVNPRSYQLASVAETDSAVAITVISPREYQLTSAAETDSATAISAIHKTITVLLSGVFEVNTAPEITVVSVAAVCIHVGSATIATSKATGHIATAKATGFFKCL